MDFRAVLRLIEEDFSRENIRWALIGGFALGALGVHRATIDLDFIIHRGDLEKVDKIMRIHGYQCVYKSDEVAQYVCQAKIFGEIDFILAHRNISYKMLERAQDKEIFSRTVKVLRPEDVIGLKIQALANDETRTSQEYFDIESLLGLYKKNLDWPLLEEYFTLFDLGHKYQEYKNKYYA
ncbi:MAG: nucleotidyl transferase AbiEii/AbiGii toxin family protein [Candidatus Omnitrophota bacterium]|nr:nucleotidyl transferase AbiEii/AbiGii toxin family protein [Candidatus Omnitrophota bacterium]